jgi:predicted GIY-YIG superfamily endonuclease
MQERAPIVHIRASRRNGTRYTGVPPDRVKRVYEHRNGLIEGFTKDYGIKRLVWFESHETMDSAILQEKRIKKWKTPVEDPFDRSRQSGLVRPGDPFRFRSIARLATRLTSCDRQWLEMGSRLRGNDK